MTASTRLRALVLRSAQAACVAIALAVVLAAVAELALRAAYAWAERTTESFPLLYERVYWAVPPWVARMSVIHEDPVLGRWMKPGVRRAYVNLFGPIGDLNDVQTLFEGLAPELPAWARSRPVWHLATNSLGLRSEEEVRVDKASGTFRVVLLGDSWTVGVNVEREESFAGRLPALLAERLGRGGVEVVNFGVIGAGVETGRRALAKVTDLAPDVVVLAYAQNDEAQVRAERGARKRRSRASADAPRTRGLAGALRELELVRLYRWLTVRDSQRIAAKLRSELSRTSGVPANAPGRPCGNPDVESSSYRAALAGLVRELTARGIGVVLLYNNVHDFLSHCTWYAMWSVAREHGIAMVDSATILEQLATGIAAEREAERGLVPAPAAGTPAGDGPEATRVVVRVDASAAPGGGGIFVMGSDPALGDMVPNTVALRDDGTHGDQRAGDGVWSRSFALDAPRVLTYLFTNGSPPGSWTGLESYRLRVFALRPGDRGRTVHLPVERFGEHVLRSDPSHPDATGHAAIGIALANAIAAQPSFAAFRSAAVGATDPRPEAPTKESAPAGPSPR